MADTVFKPFTTSQCNVAPRSKTKYISYALNASVTSTPETYCLISSDAACTGQNPISAGTSRFTRIGNRIAIEKIMVRYTIVAGDSTNAFRVLVCQSKRGNLGSSTANYIEAVAGGAGSYANPPAWSGVNVLYDNVGVTLFDADGTTRYPYVEAIIPGVKIPEKAINYFDGGDSCDFPIYMVTASDSGAIPNPAIYGFVTVFYHDLQ
jgi:hypothetical protein